MNFVKKETEQYHILTLVIEKSADIPMVRRKVKLLARSIGCSRRQIASFATAASEMARLLLNCCHGGKVKLSFLRTGDNRTNTFLEFIFHSNGACGSKRSGLEIECTKGRKLFSRAPFPSLERVFEHIEVKDGIGELPLLVRYRSNLKDLPGTENLLKRINTIRTELFTDTEESYMENLRAKHDEVLRLLREKTEQNRMLDQTNNELLQLGNDLEALAQERTIIEMSLKIADQVRNPATVIGGLSRQLIKKGQLTEQVAQKIQQIANQAEHIDQVVHRFHAMADERQNLFVQEDLVQLVKDALQSCPTIVSRGITPVFESGEQSIFIHANRQILKIAIIHVLRYTATLTQTGGRLSVRVESSKESARVSVIDRGEGFVETARKELRQPLESKPLVGQPGLSLVQHILAEHQGELKAENSTESGQEGRLVMRFPLIWHEQGNSFSD